MSFQNKPETEEIIDNTNDASNDGTYNETVGTIVLMLTSVMVILIVFLPHWALRYNRITI